MDDPLEYLTGEVNLLKARVSILEDQLTGGLPPDCFSCGVPLMGGATKHLPGCQILRMIEDVLGPESARSVRKQ